MQLGLESTWPNWTRTSTSYSYHWQCLACMIMILNCQSTSIYLRPHAWGNICRLLGLLNKVDFASTRRESAQYCQSHWRSPCVLVQLVDGSISCRSRSQSRHCRAAYARDCIAPVLVRSWGDVHWNCSRSLCQLFCLARCSSRAECAAWLKCASMTEIWAACAVGCTADFCFCFQEWNGIWIQIEGLILEFSGRHDWALDMKINIYWYAI